MGGAQPLAVTLNQGVCLIIDVDPERLERRVEHRYLDEVADDLDDAIARCEAAKAQRFGRSIGLVGNCATVLPELVRRGLAVDVVTDQTSAHDPLSYLPEGVELSEWADYAAAKPEEFTSRAQASMAKHVEAMVAFQDAGAEVFDYGNSIRDEARQGGFSRAFEIEGFVPLYIRPSSARGRARSVGRRSLGTRRTSGPPTRRCSNCSPTTTTCTAGSAPPRTGWPSRGCRRASAGSATASATRRGSASTSSSPRAR